MGRFWKIQRGGGVIRKIPSVGGYGYFLEPHNAINFVESMTSLIC